MKFTLDIQSSDQLANICGSLDKNLDNIAKNLKVNLSNKGSDLNLKKVAMAQPNQSLLKQVANILIFVALTNKTMSMLLLKMMQFLP
jgi:phosphate starvation-inducible protein PhoH